MSMLKWSICGSSCKTTGQDARAPPDLEHPFGTIKAWMGATHFQMRRLPEVASEMALHVLAYNMKRVMQILGVGGLMAAMRA
jgi:hypothetical protein